MMLMRIWHRKCTGEEGKDVIFFKMAVKVNKNIKNIQWEKSLSVVFGMMVLVFLIQINM